ncbi:MAG TPA: hypothetical protein PK879_09765, partial [Opitutaceae bacterium]|nr:hypothetical protein [Opitutaceae bacterium]
PTLPQLLAKGGYKLAVAFGGRSTSGVLFCRERRSHMSFSVRDRRFLLALVSHAGGAGTL